MQGPQWRPQLVVNAFAARFLLYDSSDLAKVAAGKLKPWQPQSYARLDVDWRLFHKRSKVEPAKLGTGVQRRYRIGAVAWDRRGGRLFVLEPFAGGAQPVVHVWRIR